jgi:hypothetical protein
MKKDNIDTLFEGLQNDFDFETPNLGHEARFLEKLKSDDTIRVSEHKLKRNIWKPLLSIAATVIICFGLFSIFNQEPEIEGLASVSPKLSETQDFFTSTIANELNKIDNERTPETEAIINDALEHINLLEENYKSLQTDLTESGNDKRVIYAMISNFQSRIDVLQNVLKQIEKIKQLKQTKNENTVTI